MIVIDADLQDPPEVIPELVAVWRQGFDMVYAQRRARLGETWLKKVTAAAFYGVMQRVGGGIRCHRILGDFRLMSRRATNALLQLREQHRFMKGLFAWVGFPSRAVEYDREPRHAGTTSWNYWKLWNLAVEGITGYTVAPLKVATYLGLAVAAFAIIYAGVVVGRTLMFGNTVPGYPSLMTATLFMGGIQLMTLGIIGEYLGRVFNEEKQRPLYIVQRIFATCQSVADLSRRIERSNREARVLSCRSERRNRIELYVGRLPLAVAMSDLCRRPTSRQTKISCEEPELSPRGRDHRAAIMHPHVRRQP